MCSYKDFISITRNVNIKDILYWKGGVMENYYEIQIILDWRTKNKWLKAPKKFHTQNYVTVRENCQKYILFIFSNWNFCSTFLKSPIYIKTYIYIVFGSNSYRLFGPNDVIWTSKIKFHKRKFGRPSIRTVKNYGWGT